MWDKNYRDYKRDESLVKQPIAPSHGLYGCEMHEINGWGDTLHHPRKKKHKILIWIRKVISSIFPRKENIIEEEK